MLAQTIQASLAPVFVLVAIGNIMNILTTRLGRVVDRSRHLQHDHAQTEGAEHDAVVIEMRYVDRRIQLIGHALLLLVLSAIGIGLTVGMLFLGEAFGQELRVATQVPFFAAIVLLLAALVHLLFETRLVAQTLRLPRALLELDRVL